MTANARPRRTLDQLRAATARARRRLRPGSSEPTEADRRHDRVALISAAFADVSGRADAPRTSPPRRPDVVLVTAVSERLGTQLDRLVHHVSYGPGNVGPSLKGASLVLVELDEGDVPGLTTDGLTALAGAAEEARRLDVPVAMWVTHGQDARVVPAAEPLLAAATHVLLAEAPALEAWRQRCPHARTTVLPVGVDPRAQRPGPRGAERVEAACVVLDPPAPGPTGLDPDPLLADPQLPWRVARLLDIWPVTRAGRSRTVPGRLRHQGVAPVNPDGVTAVVSHYPVLLDAGRGQPGSIGAVLAAAAAQTAVVTTAERAATLPDELRERVWAVDEIAELPGAIRARLHQPELRDREALRLHRAVHSGHTTATRIDELLARVGAPQPSLPRSVSAVVPTNRAHEIDNVLANLGRQRHMSTQLVLVLHGLPELTDADLRARAADAGVADLVLVRADPSTTLGVCMNLGLDAADGQYVAKMDDDNHYGAHFLGDLVAAFDHADAEIVGKWAHYVWLRSSGAVVLRHADSENTYARRIQGGAMLFDGDLVRRVRFSDIPRAVDSDILDRALAQGARVWSSDRFNFVSVRGTDRTTHTWTVPDQTFLTASGELRFFGDPREHVDV